MYKTGLVLGKFAPLHRGHQLLIETGLKQSKRLVVLIYDSPSVTNVPLSVRSRWISDLYPEAEVILGWASPEDVGYTDEIKHLNEQYVAKVLRNRKINAIFSGEPYGEHMSLFLKAKDIRVGKDEFKTCATAIREDTTGKKDFLHPRVYRDLITNVVILGGVSTGKTTLTEALAKEYNTLWQPEYGREYWDKYQVDRKLSFVELETIMLMHVAREEDKIYKANQYLFVDTNAITTECFAYYYHGHTTYDLKTKTRIFAKRYDVTFVCGVNIPYEDTEDRSGEISREVLQSMTLDYLRSNKIPFHMLTASSLEGRIAEVKDVLNKIGVKR